MKWIYYSTTADYDARFTHLYLAIHIMLKIIKRIYIHTYQSKTRTNEYDAGQIIQGQLLTEYDEYFSIVSIQHY